jgi:hypothetical protein
MATFESLPRGFVSLHTPATCTLQRPGHHPKPIQAKLHFSNPTPTIGALELAADTVVLITDDGTIELRQHQADEFVAFATSHLGRRCRLASGLLSFTDGPTPSISVADPDRIGVCRPRWAANTQWVWRVGRPLSGNPVRRQRWLFDLSWCGHGKTGLEGTPLARAPLGVEAKYKTRRPWAAGLAAKIADLDRRGRHVIRLTSSSGRVDWCLTIDAGTVHAARTDGTAFELGPVPIVESPTLADVVYDSYYQLEVPWRETIEVQVGGAGRRRR